MSVQITTAQTTRGAVTVTTSPATTLDLQTTARGQATAAPSQPTTITMTTDAS